MRRDLASAPQFILTWSASRQDQRTEVALPCLRCHGAIGKSSPRPQKHLRTCRASRRVTATASRKIWQAPRAGSHVSSGRNRSCLEKNMVRPTQLSTNRSRPSVARAVAARGLREPASVPDEIGRPPVRLTWESGDCGVVAIQENGTGFRNHPGLSSRPRGLPGRASLALRCGVMGAA